MKHLRQVIRHEWLRQRVNPATYLLFAVIGVVWYFLFFRQFFLIGKASLRPLFELFPWFALILMPALAMGSLAKEKADQTLELLLTHPIQEFSIIVGKFVNLLMIPIALTLTTVPLAIVVSQLGNFDWGAYLVQMVATWLLSGLLLSVAMVFSALLRDQVAALLTSIAANFVWMLVGTELITSRLPLRLSAFLSNFAFLTHATSLYRGVIDIRDLWFFLSITVLGLGFTYLYLERQKFGAKKQGYALLQQVMLLLSIITVLSNIVGQKIPGRVDLTQSKLYSLSSATKTVVRAVPDIVTLTLYASDNVPAQLQPVLRDTKDILADYQRLGGSKIQVIQKDPSNDAQVQSEAQSFGVQEVQFNTISQEEFNVTSGYFGIVIAYADQHEVIPFVQSTEQLEYQVTSLIYQMTRQDKPIVAFAGGHGEKSQYGELATWAEALSRQFTLTDLDFASAAATSAAIIDPQVKVLVVDAPTSPYESPLIESITQFVDRGGSLFVLGSGVLADPQSQQAVTVEHNLNALLQPFYLQINNDFVYDLRANEVIRIAGQGGLQYLSPYPLWVRAQTTESNPVVTTPQSVTITWGSSVTAQQDALKNEGWTLSPLLATSQYGGVLSQPKSISPTQEFSQENLDQQTLGVALAPAADAAKGRVVVIGSGDALINELVQATPGNSALGMASVSWLAGDTALNSLSTKLAIDRTMSFRWAQQPLIVSVIGYGTVGGVAVVIASVVFWRRRRQQNTAFTPTERIRL